MAKRFFTAVALLTVIILVAAAAISYLYNDMLKPVNPAAVEQYVFVEIPSGANTEDIAGILEHENLIHNQLIFRIFVRRYNLGQGFIAGKYSLSPAMSLSEIVYIIHSGDVYTETAWFTIPEGYTVEQIATRLDNEGLADNERILDLARNPSEDILEIIPFLMEVDDTDIDYLLEGYLFPDTYEIYSGSGEEDIVKMMLRRLDRIINESSQIRAAELGFSLHEILTIASLVEREAVVDHERSRIAGVIYNRLAIGQMLQIDATIQYILGETKEFLTYGDLEIPSPYNTYQNTGLPPGPIAAPGELSIEAALYPEDTDYFFYNFKYDGTGEHYFSHTYEEHLQNVRLAEENIQ